MAEDVHVPDEETSALSEDQREPRFRTTRWTVVFSAQGEDEEAERALQELCKTYWYPLYVYARRQGNDHHDAQDLTQGFLARLLEHNYIKDVHPSKGKLRTFLLRAFRNFITNEWHKNHTAKRGGSISKVSLDEDSWQRNRDRYEAAMTESKTPEACYDEGWAMTLLERAKDRLQELYAAENREPMFRALRPYLGTDHKHLPYAETATKLESNPDAVRKAVHRMRARFGKVLREEIEQTVASSVEADEEIRTLFAALEEL